MSHWVFDKLVYLAVRGFLCCSGYIGDDSGNGKCIPEMNNISVFMKINFLFPTSSTITAIMNGFFNQ